MLKKLDDELVDAELLGDEELIPAERINEDQLADQLVDPSQDVVGTESLSQLEIDAQLLFDEPLEEDALEDPESDQSESSWWHAFGSGDTQSFLLSLIVHTVLLMALALTPILVDHNQGRVVLTELATVEAPDDLVLAEDLAFAEEPAETMGSNSLGDAPGMALSTAAIVADVPDFEALSPQMPVVLPAFNLETRIQQAVGLVRSETPVKGMTGVGTTGTDGAIDRITYEILQSLEERPTLVVWFFDQSVSLLQRRNEIRDRFDKIYAELGIVQESQKSKRIADEPLLTSIFAFGDRVSQLTDKPTADMEEIRKTIDSIQLDLSGNEKIFTAFYLAVEKYKNYRASRPTTGPERNVMFIAVTDERGSDANGLDMTIRECQKYAIPVYVIGVPAPFGREFAYIKYVDPDPSFDQTPKWGEVDQGPESLMPERVRLGYRNNPYDEPMMDSGFGPYALSRLAYETGGIYFTVHPNRKYNARVTKREIDPFASELNYFFDPEIMEKYRPDYVSQDEYLKRTKESPLRQVLITAARMAAVETLEAPRTRFVRRDEPSLVNDLTQAQQAAARLEPQLVGLTSVLMQGQTVRGRETSPRWLAGYDLAVGTVIAHKVRAEAYNAMLAKAKRGMLFEDPKNNTWILQPADEISVGSKLEKEGQLARDLLNRVSEEHAGTPWARLAENELRIPIGWKWVEEFTDLTPPPPSRANNNPPPPQAAQDERARMLQQPPPSRPIPKL